MIELLRVFFKYFFPLLREGNFKLLFLRHFCAWSVGTARPLPATALLLTFLRIWVSKMVLLATITSVVTKFNQRFCN